MTAQNTSMRPIRETMPLDEALALVLEAATADRRAPNASPCDAAGRVLAAAASPPSTSRRSTAPRWTATPCVAEDTFGAGRYDPKVLRCIEKVYTGQVPTRRLERGRMHRDRDRRADAGGRRRGRDGRGNRRTTGRRRADLHAGVSAAARRTPGRRHRRRTDRCSRAGDLLNAEPHRRARGARRASTSRSSRRPTRRDPLDRQRDRRARASRSAPGQIYDINHFTLTRDHPGARRHRRAASAPRRTRSAGARRRDRRTRCRSRHAWCSPAAARSASAT